MLLTEDPMTYAEWLPQQPEDGPATMWGALLVDAQGFGLAAQSALDNAYMDLTGPVDRHQAQLQHDRLQGELRARGLATVVLPGISGLPDAVFPNNVYATAPGRAVLGSMRHPVRRREAARADARALLGGRFRYDLVDLSSGPVGELTGVLAIDRARRAAVCGLTGRCDREAVAPMAEALGLRGVLVTPLVAGEYHLNVVHAVLAGRAVVMFDGAFVDSAVGPSMDRAYPGRVLHLSVEEKEAFAANLIAITPETVLMSETGVRSLRADSVSWFERMGFDLVGVDVSAFEVAGGSLRCLIAELF